MSQFDIKLDYLPSHTVSQELYHHQLITYFISSAQCQDFIFRNTLTQIFTCFNQKSTVWHQESYNPSGERRLQTV